MHSTLARNRKKAYRWGVFAEKMTRMMLRCKGYRIVAHNYKTPVGEIDIIAKRGDTLIYTEVKARGIDLDAIEALGRSQRRRIEHAAVCHQQRENVRADNYRFDLVVCVKGKLPSHIKNAWREGD